MDVGAGSSSKSCLSGLLEEPGPSCTLVKEPLAVGIGDDVLAKRRNTRGHLPSALVQRPYNPHGLRPIPSRVLIEEDYVNILETIIQRDFFPDLLRLRVEKQLAEATALSNEWTINLLRRQLESLDKGVAFEGVSRLVKLLDGREIEVELSKLTLQQFQSLFTSEDNASFEQIVYQEKQRLSKAQHWIEEAAVQHNKLNSETIKALEAGERPNRLVFSNIDARNALMFPLTDGNVGTMELHQTPEKETIALCLGQYERDSSTPRLSRGEIVPSNSRLSNAGASLTEEMIIASVNKQVVAEQTQEQRSLFDSMVMEGVYSAYEILQRQRDGKSSHKGSSRNCAIQTPLVTDSNQRSYPFLHTPRLEPGVDLSPLMTWGKIAATPLVISKATPKEIPRFSIAGPSAKEQIALRLAENVSKKMQKNKQASALRDVVLTPRVPGIARTDLFGTPAGMTGLEMLRQHSRTKRTPSLQTISKLNTVKRMRVLEDTKVPGALRRDKSAPVDATVTRDQLVTAGGNRTSPAIPATAPVATDNLLNF